MGLRNYLSAAHRHLQLPGIKEKSYRYKYPDYHGITSKLIPVHLAMEHIVKLVCDKVD